jgi:23S rRNA (cytosine1962-C5)-methyltransferase
MRNSGLRRTIRKKGKWILKRGMPEQWWLRYVHGGLDFRFQAGAHVIQTHRSVSGTSRKLGLHLLADPEVRKCESRVLNLFAYTGGASLAAKAAGADVMHVDSVKPVITWARENMEGSNLSDIRWVVEDALKFVKREVRRGSTYQGSSWILRLTDGALTGKNGSLRRTSMR